MKNEPHFYLQHIRLIWGGECEAAVPGLVSLDISDNHLSLSSLNLSALPALLSLALGQRNTSSLGPRQLQHLPR